MQVMKMMLKYLPNNYKYAFTLLYLCNVFHGYRIRSKYNFNMQISKTVLMLGASTRILASGRYVDYD